MITWKDVWMDIPGEEKTDHQNNNNSPPYPPHPISNDLGPKDQIYWWS